MQKVFSLLSRERNSDGTQLSSWRSSETAVDGDFRAGVRRNFSSGVPGRPPDWNVVEGLHSVADPSCSHERGKNRVDGDLSGDRVGKGGTDFWGNQCARGVELKPNVQEKPINTSYPSDLLFDEVSQRFGEKGDFPENRDFVAGGGVRFSALHRKHLEGLGRPGNDSGHVSFGLLDGEDFPPLAKSVLFGGKCDLKTGREGGDSGLDLRTFEELRQVRHSAELSKKTVVAGDAVPSAMHKEEMLHHSSSLGTGRGNVSQGGRRISFAEATRGITLPPQFPGIKFRSPVELNGVPVVQFTAAEVEKAAEPLKWSLVGKFSKGRPELMEILTVMKRVMKFQEEFFPVALDQRHVLIRFQNRADFIRAYIKKSWWFRGQRMRCFRWTPAFSPGLESSLAPVWVGLRGMRAHMLDQGMISSIVAPIGSFLCCHPDVLKFSRPGYVMVCVEVDLSKSLVQRFLVDNGGSMVEIMVDYIGLPSFCEYCRMVGHGVSICKRKLGSEGKQNVPAVNLQQNVNQQWVRKAEDFQEKEAAGFQEVNEVEGDANWEAVVFKKLRRKVAVDSSAKLVLHVENKIFSPDDISVKHPVCSPGMHGNTPFANGVLKSPVRSTVGSSARHRLDYSAADCSLNKAVDYSGGSSQERIWNSLLIQGKFCPDQGITDSCSATNVGGLKADNDVINMTYKGSDSEPEIISRRLVENFRESSLDNSGDFQQGFTQLFR